MKRIICSFLLLVPALCSADTESEFFKNPFMGLGVWFGGDKVANNPDGDNYDAGSGAIMELGAFYQPFQNMEIMHRNSVAYRYQGAKTGKGESSGVVLETSLSKEWTNIGLGAGFHVDLMNQVSDTDGNKTKFKNSIGPVIYAEWVASEKLNFVFRYLMVDYEAEDGTGFSGNQFGVFLLVKM